MLHISSRCMAASLLVMACGSGALAQGAPAPAKSADAPAAAASPLSIVPRSAWKAAEAIPALMRRHVPRAIIVHHTGVKQNPRLPLEAKLRNLQSFSMKPGVLSETGTKKPGWGDVPYHFYISADGRVGEGRSLDFAGDTNTGYKTDGYIQIVVEGHFDTETPDPRQLSGLSQLVALLTQNHKIAGKEITGHNDHAASDCPGTKLKPYLVTLRSQVDGGAKPKP